MRLKSKTEGSSTRAEYEICGAMDVENKLNILIYVLG